MERRLAPSLLRLECSLNGLLNQLRGGVGVFRERVFVAEGALLDLISFSSDLGKKYLVLCRIVTSVGLLTS